MWVCGGEGRNVGEEIAERFLQQKENESTQENVIIGKIIFPVSKCRKRIRH